MVFIQRANFLIMSNLLEHNDQWSDLAIDKIIRPSVVESETQKLRDITLRT